MIRFAPRAVIVLDAAVRDSGKNSLHGASRFYMTDKRLVLTTAGSEEEASRIARGLVERKLAACVNIAPRVTSVYLWHGKVEEAQEWLLLIKTTNSSFERVKSAIQELHSYELPECICLPIEDGSTEYLKWIADSTA